jgi:hypothetical protein
MTAAVSRHWLPHKHCRFEGYYSKFRLNSGNHLALIVCSVHGAPKRAHMLSMTYVLSSANVAAAAAEQKLPLNKIRRSWQREVWVDETVYRAFSANDGFHAAVGQQGSMRYENDGLQYDLSAFADKQDGLSGFNLHCASIAGTREPYIHGDEQSTPAGIFALLPLPIQWHVQALSQHCDVSLSLRTPENEPDPILDPRDIQGPATMHQEKNWAASFPAGYLWVQSWDQQGKQGSGVCFAGGEAFWGVQAYLLTYRPSPEGLAAAQSARPDAADAFTFRPPFSMSIFGLSPFLKLQRYWSSPKGEDEKPSTCVLDVSTFRQRLAIRAEAAKETFFTLSAPLPEGHRPRFCTQSFEATLKIEAYRRSWPWQAWECVSREQRSDASLEFGGDYFPEAGKRAW